MDPEKLMSSFEVERRKGYLIIYGSIISITNVSIIVRNYGNIVESIPISFISPNSDRIELFVGNVGTIYPETQQDHKCTIL